jgi:hypothetical protein
MGPRLISRLENSPCLYFSLLRPRKDFFDCLLIEPRLESYFVVGLEVHASLMLQLEGAQVRADAQE